MSELKNVAVAGATGSIGPYIVQALVKHGFNVTVLTRQASRAKFDPRVHIIPTDYSPESLKAALEGQDAVVAPFGFAGIALQPQLIEAAVLAGVKRFLPSEFGFSNAAVQSSALTPPPPNKITVMKLLEEKSKEIPEFSYTAVACGTFIDWALTSMPTAGIDLKEHIATIIDTGAEKFSGTYIADVGNAVAQVLLHPAETKNREVDIASITLSRNELLAALEAETGTTWTVKRITSAEEYKIAEAAMGKGDMWTGFMHVVINAEFFGDGAGGKALVCGKDNALLGVKEVTVQELVKKVVNQVT